MNEYDKAKEIVNNVLKANEELNEFKKLLEDIKNKEINEFQKHCKMFLKS